MKNLFIIFAFLAVVCNMQAQEKVMTIDNQTPGWLSSKMTYEQQVNVEDLTITGYVNETDMKFVCGLIENRKLTSLNLYDVNLTCDKGDNLIWNGFISFSNLYLHNHMKKLVTPRKIEGRVNSSTAIFISSAEGYSIDSLYIANANVTDLVCAEPKVAVFMDDVENVENEAINLGSRMPVSIKLSDSIKKMGYIYCAKPILNIPFTLPKNLVSAGRSSDSWLNSAENFIVPISEKRFDFPNKLKEYYSGRYVGPHTYQSDTITIGKDCEHLDIILKAKIAYFKSQKPPYIQQNNLKADVVYVPKGCIETYKTNKTFQFSNIKEANEVSSISLNSNELSLFVGEEKQLAAKLQPSDAFDKKIIWSSDDYNIVNVNDNGMITALKNGETTIRARSHDGDFEAVCNVVVNRPMLNITPTNLNINVGETILLSYTISPNTAKVKDVKWVSEDETIVKFVKEGVITAVGTGITNIKIVDKDGYVLSNLISVTVNQPVTGIELSENEIKLSKIGSSVQLYAKITPDDATNKNVNWSSSNENICRVSQTGLVTATGYGTSVIFATTEEKGYMASCVVTVENIDGINNPTIGTPYYIKGNSLFVKEQYNTDYTIVSVDGKLIHKGTEQKITLKSGIYILYINGKRYKINI